MSTRTAVSPCVKFAAIFAGTAPLMAWRRRRSRRLGDLASEAAFGRPEEGQGPALSPTEPFGTAKAALRACSADRLGVGVGQMALDLTLFGSVSYSEGVGQRGWARRIRREDAANLHYHSLSPTRLDFDRQDDIAVALARPARGPQTGEDGRLQPDEAFTVRVELRLVGHRAKRQRRLG
jgi:hypothetical protein